jgi:hypothetical protein
MSGRRRLAARTALRRRRDHEGRRRATVPRCYSAAGTVHAGGLRGTSGLGLGRC